MDWNHSKILGVAIFLAMLFVLFMANLHQAKAGELNHTYFHHMRDGSCEASKHISKMRAPHKTYHEMLDAFRECGKPVGKPLIIARGH